MFTYFMVVKANKLLSQDIVKIGQTKYNPLKRCLGDITMLPFNVDAIYIIGGGKQLESKIHYAFRQYHINKEWFYLTEEIINFINNTAKLFWEKETNTCQGSVLLHKVSA